MNEVVLVVEDETTLLETLDYNLTRTAVMDAMTAWGLALSDQALSDQSDEEPPAAGAPAPVVRTQRKVQQTSTFQ